jgi:hypothetical protein
MKAFICGISLALVLTPSAHAAAKSVARTMPVSVNVNTGNRVDAYVSGWGFTTVVQTALDEPPLMSGAGPVVSIGFELRRSWFLVKRVTWDKPRKHLTIDF